VLWVLVHGPPRAGSHKTPQREKTMMFLTELRPTTWTNNAFANAAKAIKPAAETFAPRVSLYETADAFWVRAEIPGIAVDQLEITLERDEMTIKGEKAREALDGESRWLHDERLFGSFVRTFRFTTPVAQDGVQAETRDGVLTVRVAKAKEALARKINIVAK
jgi:HSP20 family protein